MVVVIAVVVARAGVSMPMRMAVNVAASDQLVPFMTIRVICIPRLHPAGSAANLSPLA